MSQRGNGTKKVKFVDKNLLYFNKPKAQHQLFQVEGSKKKFIHRNTEAV